MADSYLADSLLETSLADPQSTKQTLEITVPANEVEAETARVVESLQKKIRLPGFRPGKVPLELIRRRYQEEEAEGQNHDPSHANQEMSHVRCSFKI